MDLFKKREAERLAKLAGLPPPAPPARVAAKVTVCTYGAGGRRVWYFRLPSGTYLVTRPGKTLADPPGAQIGFIYSRPRAKRSDPLDYGVVLRTSGEEPGEQEAYQGSWERFAGAVAGLMARVK